MNPTFTKTLFLLILFSNYAHSQNIIINEIMSANNDFLADKDGDYSDWIELYNDENQPINLQGIKISDDENELEKWTFPNVTIPAKGFLLIFASGKNIVDGTELHTNFKIKQSGETLFLSNANQVISTIPAVNLPTDYSYGLLPNGVYANFYEPTPNAENTNGQGIYISHNSGFYDNEFLLTLISINSNQQIHYTLNGKVPTTNDQIYTSPLLIKNQSNRQNIVSDIPTTVLQMPPELNQKEWIAPQNVYKGNVIRYALFENDSLVSPIYSKTYFVDSTMKDRYAFPIISLVTDSLNLFDYEKGIFVPGKRFDDLGYDPYPKGNYNIRGIDAERSIHVTYFDNDGFLGFESDAGMRIRGQGSAVLPQKSLNIYFKSEYGENNIEYPIFKYTEENKRLIFRNSGQDFTRTHFRDALLQSIIEPLGLELQDFQPAILFINGEYWGIHNLREKYDRFYFKSRYGIHEDSINMLGHCGYAEEGDNSDYMELLDYISNNNLSENVHYEYVKSKIDIENFIDFQIAEIYFANFDWPCNNYKVWKTNEADSKWRFMIYDLDISFGSSERHNGYNRLGMQQAARTYENAPHCQCSNKLFRNLIQNEQFNNLFLERFEMHLKTVFEVENVVQQINQFRDLYEPEMQEHIDRWNYPSNLTEWNEHIAAMKEFAIKRPCFIKEDLMSFFDLETFDFECKPTETFENQHGLLLYPNPNNGLLYIENTNSFLSISGNLQIIDLQGRVVFQQNNVTLYDYQLANIDLTNLTNGVYFIRFQNEEFQAIEKLILVR